MEVLVMSEEKLRSIFREEIESYKPPQKSDLPDLLTRSQAANFLGRSPITIDNYARKGLISKIILDGVERSPRYQKEQLIKLKKIQNK